ncbi:MAG: Iron-sulfur assembly protein 1 [Cirrosporium novae-zelandiae]|nr:MAG: Iron-sulfur assembly protein 1 [Cirrosporium novae-zelandiae]
MSFSRCAKSVTSSSTVLSRFAASIPTLPSSYAFRCFSSVGRTHLSSKRELQTASAYRPQSLDIPPPPRNTGIPDSSIAGGIPEVNDTRPPGLTGQYGGHSASASQRFSVGISENEAQISRPVANAEAPTTSTITETKPRRKLRPRKAAMVLTPNAIGQLRSILSQPEPKLIRVGVKNRGCSGLAYHLEYVERPGKFDEVVEQDGVKVLIDSKALFSIIGSEMDWIEDKLNQRFVFKNPNISEPIPRNNAAAENHSWFKFPFAINLFNNDRYGAWNGVLEYRQAIVPKEVPEMSTECTMGTDIIMYMQSQFFISRQHLEYPRLIIEYRRIHHHPFQAPDELLMRWVLVKIIVPIIKGIKFDHEAVSDFTLGAKGNDQRPEG